MPKQLVTLVRQGRKVLANLYLKEILTTRDPCFFFMNPDMTGDTLLDMRQKFYKENLQFMHFRPAVSRHYLKSSPYANLSSLLQGPFLIAYQRVPDDKGVGISTMSNLSKEFNLALLGVKWQNQFLSPMDVKELKSENVYRGEVLSLFHSQQAKLVKALKTYHDKNTGGDQPPEKASQTPAE